MYKITTYIKWKLFKKANDICKFMTCTIFFNTFTFITEWNTQNFLTDLDTRIELSFKINCLIDWTQLILKNSFYKPISV